MNWRQGLYRLSAVFWGFWGCVVVAVFVFSITGADNSLRVVVNAVLCLGVVYAFYRATNWIIGGFFGK